MKIHLQIEIDGLKRRLFHLSSLVEDNLKRAIRAVHEGDSVLAADVVHRDEEIDRVEVEVEEECLKILALHQPVAVDLRFLVAALKMNNDLERIGDLAVNISGGHRALGGGSMPVEMTEKLIELAEKARLLVRRSLEALMEMDTAAARSVLADDDAVDADYRQFVQSIKTELAANPERAPGLVSWLLVAKSIERVADHATNIAEDTIYTAEGEIIRHGRR